MKKLKVSDIPDGKHIYTVQCEYCWTTKQMAYTKHTKKNKAHAIELLRSCGWGIILDDDGDRDVACPNCV